MRSLIEAARAPDYPAEVCLVISNRPDADGLAYAREYDIPALGLDHARYEGREHFESQMQSVLTAANIDLIACAGFMRLMTAGFVEKWRDRMLNIHPSLLPAFKGLHTHERALDSARWENHRIIKINKIQYLGRFHERDTCAAQDHREMYAPATRNGDARRVC